MTVLGVLAAGVAALADSSSHRSALGDEGALLGDPVLGPVFHDAALFRQIVCALVSESIAIPSTVAGSLAWALATQSIELS